LDISQDGDAFSQFFKIFGKLVAVLGKSFPVDKRVGSGLFENEVEVVLDIFNFDLGHNQQLYNHS
jgi:hypothetical protein